MSQPRRSPDYYDRYTALMAVLSNLDFKLDNIPTAEEAGQLKDMVQFVYDFLHDAEPAEAEDQQVIEEEEDRRGYL